MHFLQNEFEQVRRQGETNGNTVSVIEIPEIENHKLGISELELPIFFIFCDSSDDIATVDYNLDLIKIEFSRNCVLTTSDTQRIEGVYTIISLKSDSLDIMQYFLDTVYLMLSNLPEKLTINQLKNEVGKLVLLFNRLSEPAVKTIQGLWTELLVIEQSVNPEYLIESWHITPSDKYDFNDGKDKVEVKSTSKSKRVHTFSIEQLKPNSGSELMIISVLVLQTGVGKSIVDLTNLIEKRVSNPRVRFELRKKIASCVGKDFEKALEIYFDYQYSIDSILFYKGENIPSINVALVPPEISKIQFDCDLSNVPPFRKEFTSALHKAII